MDELSATATTQADGRCGKEHATHQNGPARSSRSSWCAGSVLTLPLAVRSNPAPAPPPHALSWRSQCPFALCVRYRWHHTPAQRTITTITTVLYASSLHRTLQRTNRFGFGVCVVCDMRCARRRWTSGARGAMLAVCVLSYLRESVRRSSIPPRVLMLGGIAPNIDAPDINTQVRVRVCGVFMHLRSVQQQQTCDSACAWCVSISIPEMRPTSMDMRCTMRDAARTPPTISPGFCSRSWTCKTKQEKNTKRS